MNFVLTAQGAGPGTDTCEGVLVVPASVTGIANNEAPGVTSKWNAALTSITFEEGTRIDTLGVNAFIGHTGLTQVTIPATVTTLGQNVFYNTGLSCVTIPSSVRRIGANAFEQANNIRLLRVFFLGEIPGPVADDGTHTGAFSGIGPPAKVFVSAAAAPTFVPVSGDPARWLNMELDSATHPTVAELAAASCDADLVGAGLSEDAPLQRIDRLTLAGGQNLLRVAVADATHAYFGTATNPGQIIKVRLADFTVVDELTLTGAGNLRAAVAVGSHGYFGTDTGRVMKVDLATMTQVGAATQLPASPLTAVVADSTHAYFGTATDPGQVIKLGLSDMTVVGSPLVLATGETSLLSAVSDGTYAYFGTDTSPGLVVKVRLSDLTRDSAVTLPTGENGLRSAIADDTHAYFGTATDTGRVVKVRMSDLTRIGAVILATGEKLNGDNQNAIVTDGTHAYFGTDMSPARVVKIRLSDMTRVSAVTLLTGENQLYSAVTDGTYAYFGTLTSPGQVVKVQISLAVEPDPQPPIEDAVGVVGGPVPSSIPAGEGGARWFVTLIIGALAAVVVRPRQNYRSAM